MRPDIRIFLLGTVFAAGTVSAQTPFQYLQQQRNALLMGSPTGLLNAPGSDAGQSAAPIVGPDSTLNRAGTATQAEGGPVVSGPLGDDNRAAGATAVFGASLFTRDATTVSDAPNPNYQIVPGDRV